MIILFRKFILIPFHIIYISYMRSNPVLCFNELLAVKFKIIDNALGSNADNEILHLLLPS
jgi:hypothetical protein